VTYIIKQVCYRVRQLMKTELREKIIITTIRMITFMVLSSWLSHFERREFTRFI